MLASKENIAVVLCSEELRSWRGENNIMWNRKSTCISISHQCLGESTFIDWLKSQKKKSPWDVSRPVGPLEGSWCKVQARRGKPGDSKMRPSPHSYVTLGMLCSSYRIWFLCSSYRIWFLNRIYLFWNTNGLSCGTHWNNTLDFSKLGQNQLGFGHW